MLKKTINFLAFAALDFLFGVLLLVVIIVVILQLPTASERMVKALGSPPGARVVASLTAHEVDGVSRERAWVEYETVAGEQAIRDYYNAACTKHGLTLAMPADRDIHNPDKICFYEVGVSISLDTDCTDGLCRILLEAVN